MVESVRVVVGEGEDVDKDGDDDVVGVDLYSWCVVVWSFDG